MPPKLRKITKTDIIPMEAYVQERRQRRRAIMEIKKPRRVPLGPDAQLYFESYDTMLQQILEMLYIEKGGDAQLQDELAAYNPLIPQGQELVATLMFEIDDPLRRDALLKRLGGVEETISILCHEETIRAVSEKEVERTDEDGKSSSVHFLHFPFTASAIGTFQDLSLSVHASVSHPAYQHKTLLSPQTRAALSEDFS